MIPVYNYDGHMMDMAGFVYTRYRKKSIWGIPLLVICPCQNIPGKATAKNTMLIYVHSNKKMTWIVVSKVLPFQSTGE